MADEHARAEVAVRDGREWRVATDADVAWINDGTSVTGAITAAIPPIFAAYCTLELPENGAETQTRHEQAVVALLSERTERQP